MRKKSKQSISKIQRDIWQECRRIAKKIYKNDCYTCDATNLQGANCQLGHLWPKSTLSAFLKYDLRVLRWQCYRCNINGGGMGADFRRNIVKEKGEEFMQKLEEDRKITVKAMDWYLTLLEQYRNID